MVKYNETNYGTIDSGSDSNLLLFYLIIIFGTKEILFQREKKFPFPAPSAFLA